MKLAIDGAPDYDSYIDRKFSTATSRTLPIPVPDGVMKLTTEAKLFAFDPPLALPGESITALGSRLSAYGTAPKYTIYNTLDTEKVFGVSATGSKVNTLHPDEKIDLRLPFLSPGQYTLTIEPDPVTGDAALPPLVSQNTLLVISGTELPGVIVGDLGSVKDDALAVDLLNYLGEPVRFVANLAAVRFVIPTEIRKPAGRYTDGIFWDDSVLTEAGPNGIGVTDYIERVNVTCADAGEDNTCTYGIRMLRDKLCAEGWSEPRTSYAGKILEDDSKTFYLALKVDQITNCANVVP